MARGVGRASYQGTFCGFPILKRREAESRYSDQCAMYDCLATAFVFWLPPPASYILQGAKVEQTLTTAFPQHPKFPLESYNR